MSRDFETEPPSSRKADPDAGHPPRAARSTSLAGLRRVAEASPKGKNDHGKVEQASFGGVQAALLSGIRHIDLQTDDVATLISSPGVRGPLAAVTSMSKNFEHVDADLRRLLAEVATQRPNAWNVHLKPEVQRLGGAVERFGKVWGRAQSFATEHGSPFHHRYNPNNLKQHVDDLYAAAGLDKNAPYLNAKDPTATSKLLQDAIEANLTAAKECARSVHAEIAAGNAVIAEQDLQKLISHLEEVTASLGDADEKTRHSFVLKAGKVVHIAEAIKKALPSQPSLAQVDAQGRLPSAIETIQKLIK